MSDGQEIWSRVGNLTIRTTPATKVSLKPSFSCQQHQLQHSVNHNLSLITSTNSSAHMAVVFLTIRALTPSIFKNKNTAIATGKSLITESQHI